MLSPRSDSDYTVCMLFMRINHHESRKRLSSSWLLEGDGAVDLLPTNPRNVATFRSPRRRATWGGTSQRWEGFEMETAQTKDGNAIHSQ